MGDNPVCEDCEEYVSSDDIVISLEEYDAILCEDCMRVEEDRRDAYMARGIAFIN